MKDASIQEINQVAENAWKAFHEYRNTSFRQRRQLLDAIADELDNAGDDLIQTAMDETFLPEARLKTEKARTVFQLRSYGEACEKGVWLDARIDKADATRNPPKPDIRKTMIPLGPVAVFGSSNFPFAYSTAGGDTACALAAGCPVIVKAHPAHIKTSMMVADLICKAVKKQSLPETVFSHIAGASFETGEALVKHKYVRAVGFTGSYSGGKQLFDWGNQRDRPIPVFAEMGSINPVFLLPAKLESSATDIAKMYAASITLGVGQFCTNPGLIVGIDGESLQNFLTQLGNEIRSTAPGRMLHAGIATAYSKKREAAISQQEIEVIAEAEATKEEGYGVATIATTTASVFLSNPLLREEVFGPYSLVIRCKDADEMIRVAQEAEGQLTTTVMAEKDELRNYHELIDVLKNNCGRIILNGVPTGVEVCLSMQHGGPFPATTDPRFTSVGADGIKRFARPIAFQNWNNELLPDELKEENPLGMRRMVNGEWSVVNGE